MLSIQLSLLLFQLCFNSFSLKCLESNNGKWATWNPRIGFCLKNIRKISLPSNWWLFGWFGIQVEKEIEFMIITRGFSQGANHYVNLHHRWIINPRLIYRLMKVEWMKSWDNLSGQYTFPLQWAFLYTMRWEAQQIEDYYRVGLGIMGVSWSFSILNRPRLLLEQPHTTEYIQHAQNRLFWHDSGWAEGNWWEEDIWWMSSSRWGIYYASSSTQYFFLMTLVVMLSGCLHICLTGENTTVH